NRNSYMDAGKCADTQLLRNSFSFTGHRTSAIPIPSTGTFFSVRYLSDENDVSKAGTHKTQVPVG
ncbi:MAG: hypothetical protein WB404_09835, partial [Methanoregula sp.]